jgi:hypothetical protein
MTTSRRNVSATLELKLATPKHESGAVTTFGGKELKLRMIMLERTRRRWEDNIKMDLRDIGINGTNWIWLAQDRV